MKSFREYLRESENKEINEAMKLDYVTVIQFLVENLKDPRSPDSREVLKYIGKNLK